MFVESGVNEEIIIEIFVTHSPGLPVSKKKEGENLINSAFTSGPLMNSKYKFKTINTNTIIFLFVTTNSK